MAAAFEEKSQPGTFDLSGHTEVKIEDGGKLAAAVMRCKHTLCSHERHAALLLLWILILGNERAVLHFSMFCTRVLVRWSQTTPRSKR